MAVCSSNALGLGLRSTESHLLLDPPVPQEKRPFTSPRPNSASTKAVPPQQPCRLLARLAHRPGVHDLTIGVGGHTTASLYALLPEPGRIGCSRAVCMSADACKTNLVIMGSRSSIEDLKGNFADFHRWGGFYVLMRPRARCRPYNRVQAVGCVLLGSWNLYLGKYPRSEVVDR